jgi:hypothetical protein
MKSYINRIIGIIFIIGGLVLTALITNDLFNDIPIWFFGSSTRATVLEQFYDEYYDEDWHEYINEFDVFSVYYIKYQFTTNDDEVIVSTSKIPGMEWAYLFPGREVQIRYSNADPTNNRLDDSPYIPFLLCAYIPFFIICIFVIVAGKELLDF